MPLSLFVNCTVTRPAFAESLSVSNFVSFAEICTVDAFAIAAVTVDIAPPPAPGVALAPLGVEVPRTGVDVGPPSSVQLTATAADLAHAATHTATMQARISPSGRSSH